MQVQKGEIISLENDSEEHIGEWLLVHRALPVCARSLMGYRKIEENHENSVVLELESTESPQEARDCPSFKEGTPTLASPLCYTAISSFGDTDQFYNEHLRAKRARVESIIRGMSLSPNPITLGTSGERDRERPVEKRSENYRENKRKQKLPQQQSPHVAQLAGRGKSSAKAEECHQLKEQLQVLQQQLRQLQEKFLKVYEFSDSDQSYERMEKTMHLLKGKCGDSLNESCQAATSDQHRTLLRRSISEMEEHKVSEEERRMGDLGELSSEERTFSETLKHELATVVSQTVDTVLKQILSKPSGHLAQLYNSLPISVSDSRREDFATEEYSSRKWLPGASSQNLEALTPGHLKKAKLMFFFTRYPSSTLLKTYFPDVQFNRCITSQLIKWFSNFREFYYIQMEKFARQAILEEVTDSKHLMVSRDSELFRALNMHYNKGNDFEVPDRFLEVASRTLREFFSAVRTGKDSDPSWKKPIYKIISKLDSDIPDVFKSSSCLQELLQS
ncbi:Prospero homeobox protein 2 [Chelonia mydas]|uniref:Prospero homeobox protein 2 n=1 Tax=Chelonia mydas TaxID=8469 RepID=M7BRE9_CHEMY|nr:Prospero homeobox protein 2 [Chelonia mydas]